MLPGTLFVLPDAPLSNREILPAAQVAVIERDRPDIDWEQSRNWVQPNDSAGQDQEAQRQAFLDMIRRLCAG